MSGLYHKWDLYMLKWKTIENPDEQERIRARMMYILTGDQQILKAR
jgi:hypothetical protein